MSGSENDFLLYLPSNVTTKVGTNQVNKFRTYYHDAFNLSGKWLVGCREIHVPTLTPTVTIDKFALSMVVLVKDQNDLAYRNYHIKVQQAGGYIVEITDSKCFKKAFLHHATEEFISAVDQNEADRLGVEAEYRDIPLIFHDKRQYATPVQLVEDLNKFMLRMTFEEISVYPKFTIEEDYVVLYFGKCKKWGALIPFLPYEIWVSLGFDGNNIQLLGGKFLEDERCPDTMKATTSIHNALTRHHLYTYCSLVQPHFVGHSMVPLLRIIEVPKGDKGSLVVHRFSNTYYHEIANNNFNIIDIQFNFDDGSPVNFDGGRSLVILHLKKVV